MTDPVTIVDLQVENYQRIRAIRIQPEAGAAVIPITGRNEQGKSSLLDAIAATLGGKSYVPDMPVRAGEEDAATRMTLSNGLIVRRVFNPDGTGSIVVEDGNGMRAPSPQAVLNKLYAGVAFDPISFMREKPEDQLAIIRGMVKLDVDVDAFEALNKADYDERRDVNRDLKSAEASLADMPMFADLPAEPVDEAAIETQIATAAEHNAGIERRRTSREQFTAALAGNREKLVGIDEELARLQETRAEYVRVIGEMETKIAEAPPLPEPIDVSAEQETLRNARQTNAKIAAMKAADQQKARVDELSGKSTMLTNRMEERTTAIAKAFQTAQMPVAGLTFGDGRLVLDGVPLAQASTARKLRVSTAIGMAMSPNLRVMLVRDASLLDEDGYQLLTDMATEGGFQFWVESVGKGDGTGIIIEDGSVVGAEAPEPIERNKRRRKPAEAAAQQQAVADGAAAAEIAAQSVESDPAPIAAPEPEIAPSEQQAQEEPPFVPDTPKAGLFDYD